MPINDFQAMYQHIQSVLKVADFDLFARTMQRLPIHVIQRCLSCVLKDSSLSLDVFGQMHALLKVVNVCQSPQDQRLLLEIVKADLAEYSFALLVVGAQQELSVFPLVTQWISERLTASQYESVAKQLYVQSIMSNNPYLFVQGMHAKLPLTNKDASYFLWQVLQENKHHLFVSILISAGADTETKREGKTPLMYALERNNRALIHALLDANDSSSSVGQPHKKVTFKWSDFWGSALV